MFYFCIQFLSLESRGRDSIKWAASANSFRDDIPDRLRDDIRELDQGCHPWSRSGMCLTRTTYKCFDFSFFSIKMIFLDSGLLFMFFWQNSHLRFSINAFDCFIESRKSCDDNPEVSSGMQLRNTAKCLEFVFFSQFKQLFAFVDHFLCIFDKMATSQMQLMPQNAYLRNIGENYSLLTVTNQHTGTSIDAARLSQQSGAYLGFIGGNYLPRRNNWGGTTKHKASSTFGNPPPISNPIKKQT